MLYLSMNQVGFDARTLGFPSIGTCNAIVLQTLQGLCGLHNYGGDSESQFVPRATEFKKFVQRCNMAHSAHGCNLYSVINKRHGNGTSAFNVQNWKGEMVAFAKALEFKGPIILVALRKHLANSVYVQLDLNSIGEACKVKYKDWAKMETYKDTSVATPNVPELDLKKTGDTPVMNKGTLVGSVPVYELVKSTSDKFEGIRLLKSGGTLHKAEDDYNAAIFSTR